MFDVAHRCHPIAALVTLDRVRELLSWLSPPAGGRVLDLNTGYGAWLVELLAARKDISGVGVDLALPDNLTETAKRNGVGDRVAWKEADAAQ